jgi:hypothetical protein
MKFGTRFVRLELVLEDSVKRRYGYEDDDFDWTITDYGTMTREYPSEYFFKLTDNPESPIYLMLCNFDGTISIESKIQDVLNQLVRKNTYIRTLQSENKELYEQLSMAKQNIRAVGGKT